MPTYFHCCDHWDGTDLKSLYNRCNRDSNIALDLFKKRYKKIPEIENIGIHHIYYVHMFDDLTAAAHFSKKRHKQILVIEDKNNVLDITTDIWEFPHPMVENIIPADMIYLLDT